MVVLKSKHYLHYILSPVSIHIDHGQQVAELSVEGHVGPLDLSHLTKENK